MEDVALVIRRARRGNSTHLDLSNKILSSWPQDLLKISSLRDLNLSHNSLSSVPIEILSLTTLNRLDLSYNNISSLPIEILQIPTLIYLNLEGNPIGLGLLQNYNLKSKLGDYFDRQQGSLNTSIRSVSHEDTSFRNTDLSFTKKFEETKFLDINPVAIKTGFQGVTEIPYVEIELGNLISQGGFSVVHQGYWRGTEVAVKVIVDPVITQDLRDDFENEIAMLSYLRHPSTILLMGICTKPPHFVIVTEFAKSRCLYDLLHRSRVDVSMETKLELARQIAQVFRFYHESGVVHRDLKSLNVLLDQDYTVKICDFGLSRFKSDLNKGTMQFSGTPAYMAPELFRRQAYDESIDVYAFGTLLWEIISRDIPYDGLDPQDIRDRVLRGDTALPITYSFPKKFSELIDECRSAVPSNRPSFRSIQERLK